MHNTNIQKNTYAEHKKARWRDFLLAQTSVMEMLTRLTAQFLSVLGTAGQSQDFLEMLVLWKFALEL